MSDFVYIDDYGLLGYNFYWKKRDSIPGATETDLKKLGLKDNRVQVHKDIIDVLVKIDKEMQKHGFRIYIKEGLRTKELYEFVYKKRVELFGKEITDKLLNMKDMPHATGKSVDIELWDQSKKEEVFMRNRNDGTDAYFVNYYRDKGGEQNKKLQELQDLLISTMQNNGFRLGTKREYFHFDYKPETPKNY